MTTRKPLTKDIPAGRSGARTSQAYEQAGGYQGAPQSPALDDAAEGHRGGEGLEPARPRRRGFPHRDEVELSSRWARTLRIRIIWSPTPMRWSRAPSKTACLMEGDPHQLIEGMIVAAYANRSRCRLHLPARRIHAGAGDGLHARIAEAY